MIAHVTSALLARIMEHAVAPPQPTLKQIEEAARAAGYQLEPYQRWNWINRPPRAVITTNPPRLLESTILEWHVNVLLIEGNVAKLQYVAQGVDVQYENEPSGYGKTHDMRVAAELCWKQRVEVRLPFIPLYVPLSTLREWNILETHQVLGQPDDDNAKVWPVYMTPEEFDSLPARIARELDALKSATTLRERHLCIAK